MTKQKTGCYIEDDGKTPPVHYHGLTKIVITKTKEKTYFIHKCQDCGKQDISWMWNKNVLMDTDLQGEMTWNEWQKLPFTEES